MLNYGKKVRLMGFAALAAKKAPLGLFLNAASNPFHSYSKVKGHRYGWSCALVRLMGFEPISFRRQILSLLCMPFHHSRATGSIVQANGPICQ